MKAPEATGFIRRWLLNVAPSGRGFESQRYLMKWLVLGTTIGIVAGLGAILFSLAIEFATSSALGTIVGYHPPAPIGEGSPEIHEITRPWLLPLVTTLGGLISGIIVFKLAPEAEGHGTDAAIEALHYKRGRMRARTPAIKLIASAITIGTGGSGGREGPAAQISAGFGSLLGQWLGLDAPDRRIAVAAGMGAGIGAIFRAPLGGAIMAVEILYIHDLEVEALIPSLIASIVGYSFYGAFFGFTPIFGPWPQLGFEHPIQLIYYAMLGLASGLVGLLYARSFYGITDVFHHLRLPQWLKPALGGLAVGMLGLLLPGALHTGYGWVQIAMGEGLLDLPLWVVLILPFAKILSTSLSIGSGGSGGIFGPGMVIGGLLGASFWRLTHDVLPGMPPGPAPFIIIGMMAMFGGIAHAPLAVMLMVAEMTGNLMLLAPAMVAVALSTALVGDTTIYRKQLRSRAEAPAHRMRFSFPLLASLYVNDAMVAPGLTLRGNLPVRAIESQLKLDGTEAIALDEHGQLLGLLGLAQVQAVPPAERDHTPIRELVTQPELMLAPENSLDLALDKMAARGLSWAPVVESQRVVGRLHVRDIIQSYKIMLERNVRRTKNLPAESILFEVRLGQSSPFTGHLLCEVKLPLDALVVSIMRDGELIMPRGGTRLEAGDIMMVMTDPTHEQALRSFLSDVAPERAASLQAPGTVHAR